MEPPLGPIAGRMPPKKREWLGAQLDPEHEAEAQGWFWIGGHMYQGRKRLGISKREGARRARISEALWRILESGGRAVDSKWVLPNPRPENLYAVAEVIGLPPQYLFEAVDQEMPPALTRATSDVELAKKITLLADPDRELVDRLVDRLLNPGPPRV